MKKNIFKIHSICYVTLIFMPLFCPKLDLGLVSESEAAQGHVAIKLAGTPWGNGETDGDKIWQDRKIEAAAVKNAYKIDNITSNGYVQFFGFSMHYVTVSEKPTIPDLYLEKDITVSQKGWFNNTQVKFTTKFFDTKKDFDNFCREISESQQSKPKKAIENPHTLTNLLHSFVKDIKALYIKLKTNL